jgi:hypothetical protein
MLPPAQNARLGYDDAMRADNAVATPISFPHAVHPGRALWAE